MERYPIGTCGGIRVEVQRDDRAGPGFAGFGVRLSLDEGGAVVRFPGHYGAELAARIREAEAVLATEPARARRTYRDEYLDLTALPESDGALMLSSSARIPLRMSVRVPRRDLLPLATLLESAHELVDTLRQGVALVPDRLPEDFAAAG